MRQPGSHKQFRYAVRKIASDINLTVEEFLEAR